MIEKTAMALLKRASFSAEPSKLFVCNVLDTESNAFVEAWAPRCYAFVQEALGPFQVEPLEKIEYLPDGFHAAGANASFASNGRIALSAVVKGKPGMMLEKLTHELCHAALAHFPEGDPFYEEGQVDYSVWVMAHAPYWGEYRQAMLDSAKHNLNVRQDRAVRTDSDYDRKRWAGGVYAKLAYGPHIIARLRARKEENNLTW